MIKTVTIFTTKTCSYCTMVKKYLTSKNVSFKEVNLDDYPEKREEVIKMSGAMTVPITLFTEDNGLQNIVIGYNLPKLAAALN